jgi:uncharacterized protein YdiU (UPF0061 family)
MMFCSALQPLLDEHEAELAQLEEIQQGFSQVMQTELETMWAAKFGLDSFDPELFRELMVLMTQTPVDYTIFFRELSAIPDDIAPLKKSFYRSVDSGANDPEGFHRRWSQWFAAWQSRLGNDKEVRAERRLRMQRINPKYTMREWFVAPAYQQAAEGNYAPLRQLQKVLTQPYAGQSNETESQFYRLKPSALFNVGGLSHYSCSS